MMMSTAPFYLDLNDIGFPFTDMSCSVLFVVNPSSKKLSFFLAAMSPSLHSDVD